MLDVKDIDVYYGHAKVLHDVSLSVNPGEMAFVIGRNGAGKTTLLKTICGVRAPGKGSINYDGHEIAGLPAEKVARRGIRMVAQDKRVFGSLTVRGNIELAAYAAGENVSSSLDKVVSIYPRLKDLLQLKASSLSGGQREILLIGRALVGEPKLLLIDEPTEGLAAVVIEDIFRILTEMKSRVSAVIVEQNLSIVSRLADRVFIMKEGKIERTISDKSELGNTRELERYL
jgi:ABC-type branched-subunit amino acid transport system ATPase component